MTHPTSSHWHPQMHLSRSPSSSLPCPHGPRTEGTRPGLSGVHGRRYSAACTRDSVPGVAQRQASSLIGLNLRPELQVTPAVVQLATLLALPAGPLDDAVDQALAENPVLTRRDTPACPGCGRPSRALRCPYCSSTSAQLDPADLPDQIDPRSDLLAEL